MQPLKKHIHPADLKHLHDASDPVFGPMIASHSFHQKNPPPHKKEIEDYTQNVQSNPERVSSILHTLPGISPKAIFQSPMGKKMLKPYHEAMTNVTARTGHYPLSGWAEMTSQGLYHAGEIGHLHHKVHVAEHDTHPFTVTHFDPKATEPIWQIGNLETDVPEHLYSHAAKIGLMDYLTNNVDANLGNMLYEPDEEGAPRRILAIDRARAFQYKIPNDYQSMHLTEDHPYHYLHSIDINSAMNRLVNWPKKRYVTERQPMDHAMRWWIQHSPNIRNEFRRHLDSIAHPAVQNHLRRNFETRADILDHLAHKWVARPDPDLYNPYSEGEEHRDFMTPMHRFDAGVLYR